MIIVNLFGGPGAGKSTGSAYIFAKLKMLGWNVEYITEYAKDKVWEENKTALKNQLYIFAQQFYKISSCENKVDIIVTDSPLLNSIIYNKAPRLGKSFDNMVYDLFSSYENINFLIKRIKKYNPSGRTQTEKESDALYYEIKDLLDRYKINYEEYAGDEENYKKMIEIINNKLTEKNKPFNISNIV